jgi:hypothetical protein
MGRHETTLTIDQQKMLEGVLGNDYCDNVPGQVVGEHADRLQLERVTAKQDPHPLDGEGNPKLDAKVKGQAEQEWIDDFWQHLKIDDLQQRVHRNLIRDGNYCVMVDYDVNKKRITLHREPWWDGFIGVFIGYDAFGNPLYAVKEWETPLGRRRTVYYEGGIERYANSGGGSVWVPFVLESDGLGVTPGIQNTSDPIPIPYNDLDGNPMPIPFVHFSNTSDEFENYGSSILDGGKIGAADMINDTQYDISAAARMGGYQRTWSKGYSLQKVNGKSVRPKTGPGTHYHAIEPTAEWGVLDAGDITQLIEVHKMKVESFCRNTRTPYASITGNWPSGEALYRQEKPIAGATKARQLRNAPAWVEVIHRAMEIANLYDHEGLDESVMLTAVYSDAGDRDPLSIAMADLSMWQAASAAVAAGMPLETFLKVWGWGEDQITGLSTDIANQIRAKQADLEATAPENSNVNNPTKLGTTKTGTTPKQTGSQKKPTAGLATTHQINTNVKPKP